MSRLDNRLPNWSKSIDPQARIDYTSLIPVASEFLTWQPDLRKSEVEEYSRQFCFPKLQLGKASGLYLFLRIVFDLPEQFPRDHVQVFGGWLHPSIGSSEPFRISWPVEITAGLQGTETIIHPFQGYRGKGYDAAAEYEFFANTFPARQEQALAALRIR